MKTPTTIPEMIERGQRCDMSFRGIGSNYAAEARAIEAAKRAGPKRRRTVTDCLHAAGISKKRMQKIFRCHEDFASAVLVSHFDAPDADRAKIENVILGHTWIKDGQ